MASGIPSFPSPDAGWFSACERRETENACNKVKTHLPEPGDVLRSKASELVVQEIGGLVHAHYCRADPDLPETAG